MREGQGFFLLLWKVGVMPRPRLSPRKDATSPRAWSTIADGRIARRYMYFHISLVLLIPHTEFSDICTGAFPDATSPSCRLAVADMNGAAGA